MKGSISERQLRALRYVVETHGGCRVNLHTARALEGRGLVTLSASDPRVPRATDAGRELVARDTSVIM